MNYREVLEQQVEKIRELQSRFDMESSAYPEALLRTSEQIRILIETAECMPRQVKSN